MPFFSESQALGTGSSPWTVNGNDLYPDSTSYIVGIGTNNPDTLLHLKAADGTPKIKLEGTDYDYTIEVDANHGASQNSSLLRFESDTHWAGNQVEFKNGSSNASSTISAYLTALGSSTLYFYDGDLTANGKVKTALTTNFSTDRFYLYGEDGYAGGMLTMDFSQLNDARFAFGYGNEALSNAARLAIKHTSSPQLLLDDGTSTCSFTYDDNSSDPFLLINRGLRIDANLNHIKFFDKDGDTASGNDVGSLMQYTETAANQSIIKMFMDAAAYDGNYYAFEMGAGLTFRMNKQETSGGVTDAVDAFLTIPSAGNEFSLGSGTADSVKIKTGNSAVAEFTSSGKLILTEDTAGGATQLELKNGAGDTASFAQNSTLSALDITTDDSMLRLFSTKASGNVGFAKADGTRVAKYDNSNHRFQFACALQLSSAAVTAASAAATETDGAILYLCNTSASGSNGNMTVTLPAAADSSGRFMVFKDSGGAAGTVDGSGALTNKITLDPNGSETIDGQLTLTINSDYGSVQLFCNGSAWFTIG